MSEKRKIAVADFETDPFLTNREPQPFCVGYYDGKTYIKYWGDDCADWLANHIKNKKIILYAHNGGKFDWFFLLHKIEEKRFKLINGRIAVAYIGEAELRDSYMILPLALKLHGKDEIDYKIMEEDVRNEPKNKKEILSYLKTDCLSLYDWVYKFIDRFGNKLTLASAAFDQLAKTGYDIANKTGKTYDNDFRPYYFGGRCEAIKKGYLPGKYIMVDINSAYSRAMLERHPHGSETRPLKSLDSDKPYFARVLAISNGALLYRDEEQNKIIYHRDNEQRVYHATGWEIRAGLETGTLKIIKLLGGFEHEQTADFIPYVKKFYAEKLHGKEIKDKDLETFAKLLLNAAYGKFGQNSALFKKYIMCDQGELPITQEEKDLIKAFDGSCRDFMQQEKIEFMSHLPNGLSLWSRPNPQDKYFNVATAASITGYVRAYLWRSICASTDPIYCDTDSIICRKFGGKVSNELGDWKIEGKTIDGVYIGGRKLYSMGYCTVQKNSYFCYQHPDDITKSPIKKAHKGARLEHSEIMDIALTGKTIVWEKPAPSYSIRFGTRFMSRKVTRT